MWKVSVWETTAKLICQCFKSDNYFTSLILACYQLFFSIISPQKSDISFCLFLVTPVATIDQRVERLYLWTGTESEFCLSKSRKCLRKARLRQAQKKYKRQTLWKWAKHHAALIDLLKSYFVQQMCRFCCSLIWMLFRYQEVIVMTINTPKYWLIKAFFHLQLAFLTVFRLKNIAT